MTSRGEIAWAGAAFGGAVLGGLMWAVVARLTVFAEDVAPAPSVAWPVIAAVCLVTIAAGMAAAWRARRSAVRTAGVALTIAPCTGLAILLLAGGLTVIGRVL